LDLRKATAESVSNIRGVGNVNVVLYTPETAGLLTRLNIGNMNASAEIPSDQKVDVVTGQTTYKKEHFEHLEGPLFPVVMGQVIIDPGVTPEMVLKGFSGIVVLGQLVAPEPLAGALQSRVRSVSGEFKTYPVLKQTFTGGVEMTERWLLGLEDGAEVGILGSLAVPKIIPNDLIEQKITRLFVLGKIACHEENAGVIQDRLMQGSGPLKVIPAGFEVVEKPLTLDAMLLEALPVRKLLCKEIVLIGADVTPALLDEHLDALHSEELILCPSGLRSVLLKKCDPLKDQLVFFDGLLCLIKDQETLRASFFDNMEGPVTLVVVGDLTIDAVVDPAVLAARLVKVHNQGVIHCTPQQMGVVRSRLGLQDGVLLDSTLPEEPEKEPDGDFIGNANYLAL
jgi:hypothetical protein